MFYSNYFGDRVVFSDIPWCVSFLRTAYRTQNMYSVLVFSVSSAVHYNINRIQPPDPSILLMWQSRFENIISPSVSSFREFQSEKHSLEAWGYPVNEFTRAHLPFPGSLIRSLAECSRFCLDGSQMETGLERCQARAWFGVRVMVRCLDESVHRGSQQKELTVTH